MTIDKRDDRERLNSRGSNDPEERLTKQRLPFHFKITNAFLFLPLYSPAGNLYPFNFRIGFCVGSFLFMATINFLHCHWMEREYILYRSLVDDNNNNTRVNSLSSSLFPFQASFYSTALKTLISVSTVILLGLIVAYHALEVQVSVPRNRIKYCIIAQLHFFIHLAVIYDRQLRG